MNLISEKCNVPVLLTIFNRPDKVRKVITSLAAVKPNQIFVSADGPRAGYSGDAEKCVLAREALSGIDWPCEVITYLREKNFGCDPAVSTAISWFFEHVDYGVVLEDDCLPHPDFFRFCSELFERFSDDKRIMQISGLAPYPPRKNAYDYHFSRSFRCHAWGTWRRAWSLYSDDVEIYWADIETILKGYYPHTEDLWAKMDRYALFKQGRRNNWDFKWNIACFAHNGLSIVPEKNLVVNIGFDEEGTHTTSSNHWLAGLKTSPLRFPLRHPQFVFADSSQEERLRSTIFRSLNYKGRLVSRYRSLLAACRDFLKALQ